MRLLDELEAEHVLIDRVLGALRTFVAARRRGAADATDGRSFLAFFRLFAGESHHAREEGVLFPALARECELPLDRGPIAALCGDHHAMSVTLSALAPLLDAELDDAAGARLEELAIAYSHALWHHIDAENSVLLPESASRLRRANVAELEARGPTADEARARADGVLLVEKYPPKVDLVVIRGEGCVLCPSFGVSCDGVEREWWSAHEWDELPDLSD